jgi:hypothetical protein
MDSVKIFIDTDTEITFILEKVAEARSDRVCLVIPDRAAVMSSIVGLRLIKHIIDKSNKLLVLVTFDELGAELARKAGLIVVSRVGEVHEGVWEQAQRDKFAFKKKNSKSHYVPAEVSAAIDESLTSATFPDEQKVVEYETIDDDEPEIVSEALANEVTDGEDAHEKERDIPQIQIIVDDLDLENEKIDDEVIPVASEPDVPVVPEIKPIPDDKPQKRIRKVAPTKSGITNLSFSVGKDVAEKKN